MLELTDPDLFVDQPRRSRQQEQQTEERAAPLTGVAHQNAASSRIAAARSDACGRMWSSSVGA